ncbi:replication licensing factor Cdt1 [Mortierella sp. AM989]|nr:replication licensing factor Cdt1 [Mortierella sp. AM989]
MTAGNQTRLGFVQQKPGSKRPLHSKQSKAEISADAGPDVGITAPLAPAEQLLMVGIRNQSMEEKLAAYKKTKEEKAALKITQVSEAHRRTSPRSTILQRTTTKISTSKSQKLIEFKRSSEMEEQDLPAIATQSGNQAAESNDDETSTQTEDEPAITVSEAQEDATEGRSTPDEETSGNEPITNSKSIDSEHSAQSATASEDGKPVAEDTNLKEAKIHSDDDEDDIHPLARTVVKAAPRTSLGKVHVEESSENNHKTENYKPASSLFKIPRKPVIQEPTVNNLLPLPSHMSVLFANFKALENVHTFTKRQGQLCFYHKMRKHVELQSSRNFEIKQLAQFRTILPEGYRFTAAPCLFEGVKTRSILIELLDLKDEVGGNFIPQEEKRRTLFMKRMYDHVKQHHQKFLCSTNPTRTDTYPHSWHPDFDLESVTPIDEAEIPLLKPAVVDILDVNLRDLGSRRDLVKRTMKEELPTVPSSAEKEKRHISSEELAKVAPDSPGVKALSALEQLKERIRQKQLQRKEADLKVKTPEEKRQALIASRLPAVFDLIRFKRVDIIPLKSLTEQVVKSSRMPISEVDGKESLEMLAEALPEWCNVFSVGDGARYFKVLRHDDKKAKIVHDEKALRARLVAKSMSSI